jgi:hypothetical protein
MGQLLSQMGNAVFLIMGLWEIQWHSPFLLAVVRLSMIAPAVLRVAGGAVVDRYDPRQIMLLADIGRGAATLLGLAALTIWGLPIPDITVLLRIDSLGNPLCGPAEGVIVPGLVRLLGLIVGLNFTFTAAFTRLPYWIRHVLYGDKPVYGMVSAS